MNRTELIILTIIIFIANCGEKSQVYTQLELTDTLLYKNLVDSANTILENTAPVTEEDSAYFFVLKAQVNYRQRIKTNDFSKINFSIKYYENHTDKIKLANAYYYKALIFTRNDTLPDDVFILLKKAEHLALKTSDDDLKNKVCSALTYVNYLKNETEEALKYAQKEYFYAKKLNRRRDIAYALIKLSISHNELGQKDSAEYYIMQCRALENEVNNDDKAFIYNLLGECFTNDNPDAALNYFFKSLKYQKLPNTYKNIAEIYYAKNDTLNWIIYCDSALQNSWYETKIKILSSIAQKNYDNKNFTAYKMTTDEIIKNMKKFYQQENDNYVLEIQRKFDFKRQKSEYENKIWFSLSAISFLIAILAVSFMFYKQKLNNVQQKNLELENKSFKLYTELKKLNKQINNYNSQINFLKSQKEELSNESENLSSVILSYENMILELENKINKLNTRNSKFLEIGKNIFEMIKDNKSITNYKTEWANCLYYFIINIQDGEKFFSQYKELTIADKIFLICDDYFNKSDSDISTILSTQLSTIRSHRTKLKTKLI